MRISYTQYSLINKWLESGKNEDLDKAINYYLGFVDPPTPAMLKGTKIHEAIAEKDLIFSDFEETNRVRELHIELEIDKHVMHGYADCIIDDIKLVDYKASNAEFYKSSMFYKNGLFEHYKEQLHFYSIIKPALQFGKLIRVDKKTLKKSGVEKIMMVEESETVEFTDETRSRLLDKVMYSIDKFEKYI